MRDRGIRRCAAVCLCASAVCGCGPPLCPSTIHPAQISVWLAAEWPAVEDRVLVVSCPAGRECGFLDGPVSGEASGELSITTPLRPPEVLVQVSEPGSTEIAAELVLEVDYRLDGRRTACGGDARAAVVVPVG